jgi:hypothetical protein
MNTLMPLQHKLQLELRTTALSLGHPECNLEFR